MSFPDILTLAEKYRAAVSQKVNYWAALRINAKFKFKPLEKIILAKPKSRSIAYVLLYNDI